MRILVIGKGHLGTYLAERFEVPRELHWCGNMLEAPLNLRPDVVINTAAKTDIDWCQSHPLEAWQNNVVEPLALFQKASLDLEGPYIHISSGCLWQGPADGTKFFFPNSPPDPACFYTWTKAACDALLMDHANMHGGRLAILRPRQLYSHLPFDRNVLMKLIKYPKLHDNKNSMTSAETVAKTIEKVMDRTISTPRVLNVYEDGVSSPYEVGMFLHQAGLRSEPEKEAKEILDQDGRVHRVDVVMYDSYFEAKVDPPNVLNELARVIAEFTRHRHGI